jgi:hypothetical protein
MPFFPNDLTPMLFVIVIFSFAAVVVIAIIAAGVIKRKKEIEAYKTAIEKGLPLADLKLAKSPVTTLKSGLVWVAIGIGLFIVILAQGGTKSLAVSAIPTLIGVALIVSYLVEKKTAE